MIKRFNDWLAQRLGNMLSSMAFFYVCVVLDLVELGPVIAAHDTITWCAYISQSVIQLVALPILGAMQKVTQGSHEKSHDHHREHARKLDQILRIIDVDMKRYEIRDLLLGKLKANRSRQSSGAGDDYWNSVIDTVADVFGVEIV